MFSPPPPPQDHTIPEVPRVPRSYASASLATRQRRPPPYPSLPVLPSDQPFDFEANIHHGAMAGPSDISRNRSRRLAASPPLAAAPPPHHTPAMGLGGGLISLNRSQVNSHRRDFLRQHARGVMGHAGNAMRRIYTAIIGNNNEDDEFLGPRDDDDYSAIQMLLAQDLGLEPGDDDNRFDHPARPYVWQEILFRRRHGRGRNQEEDYKPEHTHPGKAESGFTFDFAPSSPTECSSSSDIKSKATKAPIVIDLEAMDTEADTPGAGPSTAPSSPGSLSLQTLLVCAKCLDPLVLGAGLVGEESRTRKVWALRCGHMIDGKCLDVVGVPEHGSSTQGNESVDDGKGKGKAVDLKGKGKAQPDEQRPSPSEPNPIRSRLRSRAPPPSSPPSPSSSRFSRPLAPSSPLHSVLGKRKRTSSSTKDKIEATHEWECPVVGCKRVHVSVKMGGVWVPEPDSPVAVGKGKSKWSPAVAQAEEGGRGAVAVFV